MIDEPLTGEQWAALEWLRDNAPMTPRKLDSAIGGGRLLPGALRDLRSADLVAGTLAELTPAGRAALAIGSYDQSPKPAAPKGGRP